MKIIGTDGSILECLNSGYLIMGYDPKECFLDSGKVDPEYQFKFWETFYPEVKDDTFEGTAEPETGEQIDALIDRVSHSQYSFASLSELIEAYTRNKKDIDSLCDCAFDTSLDGYVLYGVLNLADSYNSYNGELFQ